MSLPLIYLLALYVRLRVLQAILIAKDDHHGVTELRLRLDALAAPPLSAPVCLLGMLLRVRVVARVLLLSAAQYVHQLELHADH
jgi:hypothetical protein